MAMIRDRQEIFELTGIPLSHMAGFQTVADRERCIIMNRAVGLACTQLIEEGYSSKGFHVKAKSCNWGPMSGFVLDDPRLSKRRPTEDNETAQRRALRHAIDDDHAKVTKLYITEARRQHLVNIGAIIKRGGGKDRVSYIARQYPDQARGRASGEALRECMFVLEHTPGRRLKNPPSASMWAVRYGDGTDPDHTSNITDGGAVYAMVNPAGLGGRAGGVRNAMTGDYDLFSIAVEASLYRPGQTHQVWNNGVEWDREGLDDRMVGVDQLTRNLQSNNPQLRANPGEDPHVGNMSIRHHMIRNALNEEFRRRGYVGGNMVHHSDEAGRPFIEDVDLPVFAVVPNQNRPFGLSSVTDLREFLNLYCTYGGYVPFLNPGWISWLVNGRQRGPMRMEIQLQHQRRKMGFGIGR